MGGLPFKEYDFWAYLSAGFLFLFALDHVLGTKQFSREQWTVVQAVVAGSAAYTVGQLVAGLSFQLFECVLVGQLLGPPSQVLFGMVQRPRIVKVLVPRYYSALPASVTEKALAKGSAHGVTAPGEALFWPAYESAKNTPAVAAKLQIFMNQYGFCRNMALVALISAGMLAGFYKWGPGTEIDRWCAWAAAAVGIGLLLRYLKFYRLFSVEVFTSYAYAKASQ